VVCQQVLPFRLGTEFNGTTRAQSGFIPPDKMGAIGPSHFVELINGRFVRYSRLGVQQEMRTLNNFWNAALAAGGGGTVQGSFSFDPRIIYDRHHDRWFATSVDASRSPNSGILIGVTLGNDPSLANWRGFRVDADPNDLRWADFPMMGVNNQWLTITNNMFANTTGGASTSVSVLSIPTSSLASATPSLGGSRYWVDETSDPMNPLIDELGFALHPTHDYSNSFADTAYLVSRSNNTTLQVGTLTGDISNPTLTGSRFLTTQNRSMGDINAPQLGPNDNIDAGGNRFSSYPVIVNGKIWGVHSFDSGGLSRSVVYRIDAATNMLEYEGAIPISDTDLWTYYPSIAVNELGNVAVAFSASDDDSYVGTYAIAGRFDGVNVQWGTEQLLQPGLGNYLALDSNNRNRWGDYSAIQVDPNDPRRFWTIQEYANATNSYRTRINELIVPIGDFNLDGAFDCADVDGLVAVVAAGTNDLTYDLDGNGLVDSTDLEIWLTEAGGVNNASGNPYLPGDASLDGLVDGSDFGIWNGNKFTSMAAWCSGDFNADGSVDGSDLGIWNSNKFLSSLDNVDQVPEPGNRVVSVCGDRSDNVPTEPNTVSCVRVPGGRSDRRQLFDGFSQYCCLS
jgi:hypothetical protein